MIRIFTTARAWFALMQEGEGQPVILGVGVLGLLREEREPRPAKEIRQSRVDPAGRIDQDRGARLDTQRTLAAVDPGPRVQLRQEPSRHRHVTRGPVQQPLPTEQIANTRFHAAHHNTSASNTPGPSREGVPVLARARRPIGRHRLYQHFTTETVQTKAVGKHRYSCTAAPPKDEYRHLDDTARQWWWSCRPRVCTGVAPGRVHCGTGRLVGPQVAFPFPSERQDCSEGLRPSGQPSGLSSHASPRP